MWNWKNQGSGEKFYNMSQNWGNPTTYSFKARFIEIFLLTYLQIAVLILYLQVRSNSQHFRIMQ